MSIFVFDNDPTSTYYSQITELDGREYLFTFYWNQRAALWFMDVADQDEVPIASTVAITVGTVLLRGVIDTRLWPGTLFAFDVSAPDGDPGLDPGISDLGARVLILYDDGQPLDLAA